MSRDFTPREHLEVEKHFGYSIWSFLESAKFSYEGEEWLMCEPAEIKARKQYPLLGKLLNRQFVPLFESLSSVEGGLELLKEKDEELSLYVEKGEGDTNSYLIRWFEGNLDTNFYYSERNHEMFCEEMVKEARNRNIVREVQLLEDVDDSVGIDLGDGHGLFIQVVNYGEGKEYMLELNDIIDDAYEPCAKQNASSEFGNMEKLLSVIDEYLEANLLNKKKEKENREKS